MNIPSLYEIESAMIRKGYIRFTAEMSVNIVGIRSSERYGDGDRFDDYITLFYKAQWAQSFFAFPATTDPGSYYRENPLNVHGTAILKAGQYRSAFAIGMHRDYPALIQIAPLTVYRDSNRDDKIDTKRSPEETGMYGIHIHHAGAVPEKQVGRWSAGCQVFQDAGHFDFFLSVVKRSMIHHGPNVSYTLIEENDLPKGRRGYGWPHTL